jgi:hypothetical protein
MLCKQDVHTDKEIVINRLDIIIKKYKKRTCLLIDVAVLADRNVRHEENKIQEFLCRDTNNVDHEIYDYSGATGIATKVLKKNLEAIAKREIFNRFTTEDSCTLGTSQVYRCCCSLKLEA